MQRNMPYARPGFGGGGGRASVRCLLPCAIAPNCALPVRKPTLNPCVPRAGARRGVGRYATTASSQVSRTASLIQCAASGACACAFSSQHAAQVDC